MLNDSIVSTTMNKVQYRFFYSMLIKAILDEAIREQQKVEVGVAREGGNRRKSPKTILDSSTAISSRPDPMRNNS